MRMLAMPCSHIANYFARRVSHYSNPEDIANPAVKPFAIQNAILNIQYDKQPFGVTLRVAKKMVQ